MLESLPALPIAQKRMEMLRPLDERMVIQLHVVHNLKFANRYQLGKIVPLRSGKAAMASSATTKLEIDATTAGAISADDRSGVVPDIPLRARAGFSLRCWRRIPFSLLWESRTVSISAPARGALQRDRAPNNKELAGEVS